MSERPHAQNRLGRILIVCTANICRSPYAEYRLQEQLIRRGITDVAVDSAGIGANAGQPMAKRIAAALHGKNIETRDFQSKRLRRELITEADLILTAEVQQRAAVVRLDPHALPKVFTLLQFARLVTLVSSGVSTTGVNDSALLQLVRASAAMRGTSRPSAGMDDDVADPWGRWTPAYRRAFKLIDHATETIADGMALQVARAAQTSRGR